jgi:formylglycine-generating enzyme required for sulfatase activity
MHNGQPTGAQTLSTTEDGSYYLNGATSTSDILSITRKPNATWVIPSEDEWYKAAYHKNDGTTGNYWDYPTRTNSTPSNVLDPTGTNNANFFDWWSTSQYTIGEPYYRTEVGAFVNSPSSYGTFDQGGNAWEWNDTIVNHSYGQFRGLRGGSFGDWGFGPGGTGYMHASYHYDYPDDNPWFEDGLLGVRFAVVPEPATLALLVLGGLAMLRRR